MAEMSEPASRGRRRETPALQHERPGWRNTWRRCVTPASAGAAPLNSLLSLLVIGIRADPADGRLADA
jgi:hypothetical protein